MCHYYKKLNCTKTLHHWNEATPPGINKTNGNNVSNSGEWCGKSSTRIQQAHWESSDYVKKTKAKAQKKVETAIKMASKKETEDNNK